MIGISIKVQIVDDKSILAVSNDRGPCYHSTVLYCTVRTGCSNSPLSFFSLYLSFPAMAPANDTALLQNLREGSAKLADLEPGLGRSSSDQALYQLAALLVRKSLRSYGIHFFIYILCPRS